MCGIVGYIGYQKKTLEVILEGLKRLEYRVYDSVGVALMNGSNVSIVKSEGKLDNLLAKLESTPIEGDVGVGHTRWATHGASSERNAHPQVAGATLVVHNGIIENFGILKKELIDKGCEFTSDTDTEVIAHMIENGINAGSSFEKAVQDAFSKIEGSYAVVAINENEPDKIIGIRKFSPLILAVGDENEYFFASDVSAVLPFTRKVIFLEEGDIAVIDRKEGIKIIDAQGRITDREVTTITWDPIQAEKQGFKHYMLKEIYEQPKAVLDTIRGRFDPVTGDIRLDDIDSQRMREVKKIVIIACGTSYHAGLVGKYMIEKTSRIPVEVDMASEFRYREPIIDSNTLVIAVSQSGETADTSEALLEAKRAGAYTLAVTNVFGSKISREADCVLNTCAGPEIGVASTKAFTTQLCVLYMLALHLGGLFSVISESRQKNLVDELIKLPKTLEIVLKLNDRLLELAREFQKYENFLFLGRGINYPIALEGALKLKEISYIHAEGYAAGEMKHGPIALIDEHMPVVIVAPDDEIIFSKIVSNIQEIKTRRGKIILLTSEDKLGEFESLTDDVILIPKTDPMISPIVAVIPLQLLAYHVASFKGTDIDQPRNLAKVVTVE